MADAGKASRQAAKRLERKESVTELLLGAMLAVISKTDLLRASMVNRLL
jgi:hypothetical protein